MYAPLAIPGIENSPLAGLRILHVLDHSLPLHSGYAFRTMAILREQRRMGWHTIHLTTPKHTEAGPMVEEIEGLRFHRTPPLSGFGTTIGGLSEARFVLWLARRILQVAAAEAPDIIHAHSPVLNTLASLKAARRLGLPIVAEVRAFWEDAAVGHQTTRENGLRYRMSRATETYALRRSDAVVAICDGLKSDMIRRGLPEEKIALVPNGVDIADFPLRDAARRSEVARDLARRLNLEGSIVLAYFGSFYRYEGLDLLFAALPAILNRNPEVRVLLAGGGPEEQRLRQQAQALGLSTVVRFAGRVPHNEMALYYELADVSVFPRRASRVTDLVTPLKPLEAMASGSVVLASDVGGHRELIRYGETGYLFRADDPAAISDALARALDSRAQWSLIQHHARQFVRTRRSWRICAEGYSHAYARALRVDVPSPA
jgi:PEP-CTERM/exosortase A-associated glycosyltransferase